MQMLFLSLVAIVAITSTFAEEEQLSDNREVLRNQERKFRSIKLDAATGKFAVIAPTQWNYDYFGRANCKGTIEDKCGPYHWGKIKPNPGVTNMCYGNFQTPINITVNFPVDRTLKFPVLDVKEGGCKKYTQFCDDHAFEVSFYEKDWECKNVGLTYKGIKYTMIQLHFHCPSEHAIRGRLPDCEVHLVHASAAGQLLVLGTMLDVKTGPNAFNPTIRKWLNDAGYLSRKGKPQPVDVAYEWFIDTPTPFNPYAAFIPKSKTFYNYPGSLTTYPCTEGVEWIVFDEIISMDNDQLQLLRQGVMAFPGTIAYARGDDNRPVQLLKGRKVYKYVEPTKAPTRKPTVRRVV